MKSRLAAAALAMSLLSGCYTVRVTTAAAQSAAPATEKTNYHFVYGLTSADVTAVDCPYGIAKIEQEIPWWHVFLAGITFGIVDASSTKYTCVAAPATAAAPAQ